jgi:hypothetical protein
MRRSTIVIVVAFIAVLAMVTPVIVTRYYLTPSSQQRVIDQVHAATVVSAP